MLVVNRSFSDIISNFGLAYVSQTLQIYDISPHTGYRSLYVCVINLKQSYE